MKTGAVGVLIAGLMMALGQAQAQPAQQVLPGPVVGAPALMPQVRLRPDQLALLQSTLAGADAHGFAPGQFAPASRDPASVIAATLRYAKAVRSGQLTGASFPEDWGLRPTYYDPAPEFAKAVAQDNLQAWLASLPPAYPGYEVLQEGLAKYRQIAADGGWARLAEGPDLKAGAVGPMVEALRVRLAAEDPRVPEYLPVVKLKPGAPRPAAGEPQAGDPIFDQSMTDALKRAQKRLGLEQSGVLGKASRAALNVPVNERIGQIVANMERWRWLPPQMPVDRVQVNIAAAVLTVFRDDEPLMSMRAVTGRPGNETPMLHSQINSIVLNPPWNVPAGIAAKELWPKGKAALAAQGFRFIPTGDGGERLQQAPGPNSALGQVKFDFPNAYAVYLHDTPSKGGFSRIGRLASHGCVRLEKPVALARLMLEGDPNWTPEVIDTTLAAGKTVRAPVIRPVDVFLLYWTAYVTPDGQVNFRGDPYGWDKLLLQRIATQAPVA